MRLCDLPARRKACVTHVEITEGADLLGRRLQDVGFVPGEIVSVVARAHWGGDPLLVQVGGTRFALRVAEASKIIVTVSV